MGLYTTLVCEMRVKPDFWPLACAIHEGRAFWSPMLGDAALSRAHCIPQGAVVFMPWDDVSQQTQRGFLCPHGRIWAFACSLKDKGEIKAFWECIVPTLAEKVIRFESWYGGDTAPRVYAAKGADDPQ